MFLTVHASAGVLIGHYAKNIWLAFILGFISHFILDAIPHGDENLIIDKADITKKEIMKVLALASSDGLVMLSVLGLLYMSGQFELTPSIIAAVIGTILPDVFNGIYMVTKFSWFEKFSHWHFQAHYIFKKYLVSLSTGLVIQFLTVTSLIIILIIAK